MDTILARYLARYFRLRDACIITSPPIAARPSAEDSRIETATDSAELCGSGKSGHTSRSYPSPSETHSRIDQTSATPTPCHKHHHSEIRPMMTANGIPSDEIHSDSENPSATTAWGGIHSDSETWTSRIEIGSDSETLTSRIEICSDSETRMEICSEIASDGGKASDFSEGIGRTTSAPLETEIVCISK